MNTNKPIPLSSLFKPFVDRIREILSNSKTTDVEKKYPEEEYKKDLELAKSAFDNELIEYDEYVEKVNFLKSQYEDINNKKQNYADAIIKNNKGEILLLRRSITDSFEPDTWGLPGGKIEKGEEPLKAVIREVKEETNLTVKEATLLSTKNIDGGLIYYFLCKVDFDDSQPIILDNDEHISYEFCSKSDYQKMNLILDLKETLNNLDIQDTKFHLFPTFGSDKSRYSNIIEEIANIHPVAKDLFMLQLFAQNEIDIDDYVDYVEKAYKEKDNDLTQIKGKDQNGVQVIKWVTKSDLRKLAKHAKNTSHKDLETTIKESAHPQLRQIAHAEIKRREVEEKTPEEKEGYEAHEYHGKEFKYSSKENKHLDDEGNEADPAKLYQYYDMRHREQGDKLKQLNVDLETSTKQKQALGNKLKKVYYQKVSKSKFTGDEEVDYKTAISKLEKIGLSESDIDPERVKRIIAKKNIKSPIKKAEEAEMGENASERAKNFISNQNN